MGWLRNIFGIVTGFFAGGGLWVYVAGALAIAIPVSYGTWQVQNWRYGKKEADRLAKIVKVTEKQAMVDNKSTEERIKTVTVYKQGATKIVERIVYESIKNPAPVICDRSPASLRDLTELITSANRAR